MTATLPRKQARPDEPPAVRPSAQRRIARLTQLINQALDRVLPKAAAPPQVIHEGMRYCVLSGGKRFRPLLCLAACEALGQPPRRALALACALECIHTYSLVHDDLPAMDNADQRRGQPTCHRKFGEGNAILVGDALLTLAFDLLGRDGTPNSLAIIRLLGRSCGTWGLIGGQVLDLQAISQPRLATERSLRDIAQRKTAALITASVVAGALAGGAGTVHLARLSRYGSDVGLAFQLLDDVHDGEGLAQALGADQARAEAERLISRAIQGLAPLGGRADLLRQLAAWLAQTA
ncbi:MAG: polyprenyl synthetase family protein [Candidatus Omnitrophica bacterium]|nr:polyprenyl synthetase family protein [Candidatus Omnitrophota bacterium]